MTIVVALINIALIGWLAYRSARSTTYWAGLIVRLISGIAVGIVYLKYYQSGDTWVLFREACNVNDFQTFFENTRSRSGFFVSILTVVNLITAKNYWLTSLWLSFFSSWCSYKLVTTLDHTIPWSKIPSRISLLFFPSVVFWSSGILKETLAFGAVAMLASYWLMLMRGQKITWQLLVGVVLFSILLLKLKYYWGAVLFPSMIAGLIIHWALEKKTWNRWILFSSWIIVFFILLVGVSFSHPNFYADRFVAMIVESHDEFIAISRPDNLIRYHNLSPGWASLVINSPWALLSGLFRPFILEASSPTAIIAAVENLFLLVLVLWKIRSMHVMAENRLIAFSTAIYIIVLCIFLALSSPNLGTLARYRVGFLPLFVLMIFIDHPLLKFFNGKPSDNFRGQPPRQGGSRDI